MCTKWKPSAMLTWWYVFMRKFHFEGVYKMANVVQFKIVGVVDDILVILVYFWMNLVRNRYSKDDFGVLYPPPIIVLK